VRIAWDTITADQFDPLCEALIRRVHRHDVPPSPVRVYDGSGGDGGRDVTVATSEGLVVYQLKFFPGRIGARSPKRRPQVEASLAAARKHDPIRWVLVVPTRLNQAEHSWFDGLRAKEKFDVELWDIPALDERLAEHADLVVQHLRGTHEWLTDAVKTFRAEAAVLDGPHDLAQRVQTLAGRADEQHPDWRWDFAYQDGVVTQTLAAKHPAAHLTSPVSIDFVAAFTDDPQGVELQDRWLAAVRFGAPGTVTLPAGTVNEVTVTGPEFLAGVERVERITMVPMAADVPPQQVRLRVVDADGETMHELLGTTRRWGSGTDGHHVSAVLDGVTVNLTIDGSEQGTGHVDIGLALDQCRSAREAAAALRTVLDVRPPHHLVVTVGPYTCRVELRPHTEAELRVLQRGLQIMKDVSAVAEALDLPLPVPSELSGADVQDLRRAGLLLAGEVVELHRGTVTGRWAPRQASRFLRDTTDVDQYAFAVLGEHRLQVLGHWLPFPSLAMYCRKATRRAPATRAPASPNGTVPIEIRPAQGEAWLGRVIDDLDDLDLAREPVDLNG